MPQFATFFLILLAALSFSAVFKRLHLPWVLSLILAGIFLGPSGFNLIQIDSTLSFLGDIGLIFLMFMAGLETKLSALSSKKGSIIFLSVINGAIPFIVGIGIAWYFGYDTIATILLGITFISSSVALVIPTLESTNLINKPIGAAILATTLIQDIASLFLLSILLQTTNPQTAIPLPLFYILIAGIFILARFTIKKLNLFSQTWLSRFFKTKQDRFEQELRMVIVILLGAVIVFELLGLHSIIAGFFTGLLLSETLKEEHIKEKIHAVSYGLFIPIFFIIIGMQTDFKIFLEANSVVLFTVIVILGSMTSKLASGWVGARIKKYSPRQSFLFGFSSIPQLSTTLAVVYTGFQMNLIDSKLVTAMITLSIVTTFVSPLLMNWYTKAYRKELAK